MVKYLSIHNSSLALRYFLMEMARPLLYIYIYIYIFFFFLNFFIEFFFVCFGLLIPPEQALPEVSTQQCTMKDEW